MICVKLTCSCIIALLHRWQILRWSEHVVVVFSAVFPNLAQHKMQHHPPATVTAAQHISGASLNFPSCLPAPPPSCSPRWASGGARGPAGAPGPPGVGAAAARPPRRHRGPPARPPASAVERHGSRKVPHGSVEREGTCFDYLWCRGIFLDPSPWWENEILGFELFWFHLSSCCRLYWLMLFDACYIYLL